MRVESEALAVKGFTGSPRPSRASGRAARTRQLWELLDMDGFDFGGSGAIDFPDVGQFGRHSLIDEVSYQGPFAFVPILVLAIEEAASQGYRGYATPPIGPPRQASGRSGLDWTAPRFRSRAGSRDGRGERIRREARRVAAVGRSIHLLDAFYRQYLSDEATASRPLPRRLV